MIVSVGQLVFKPRKYHKGVSKLLRYPAKATNLLIGQNDLSFISASLRRMKLKVCSNILRICEDFSDTQDYRSF